MNFELLQCGTDTQVWKIVSKTDHSSLLGLVVVYVDDFLILCPSGVMRDGLIAAFKNVWTLRPETVLGPDSDLTFWGLELVHKPTGIQIRQRKFIETLLEKHNFKDETKSIPSITMESPREPDVPTPEDLENFKDLLVNSIG